MEEPILPVDNTIKLETYYKSATKLFSEAKSQFLLQQKSGNAAERDTAKRLLLRFANLVIHTLPSHRELKPLVQNKQKLPQEFSTLRSLCEDALTYLETIKEQERSLSTLQKSSSKETQESITHLNESAESKLPTQIPNQNDTNLPPSSSNISTLPHEDSAFANESVPSSEPVTPMQSFHSFESAGDAQSLPSTPFLHEDRRVPQHYGKLHPLHRTMQDFEVLEVLGEGTFGKCLKVRDMKAIPPLYCVIKRIPFQTVKDIVPISTEIQILRKLSHPNIVQYYTSFVNENSMCLVMEYCNGGDLRQWIERREQENNGVWTPVEEDLLRKWTCMMLDAMNCVHEKEILHRDLKPSNVFLKTTSSGVDIKIGDFGLSYELMQHKEKASTRAGTVIYWPPEVHAGGLPEKSSDVYSIGCILYEVCMGTHRPATSLLLFDKKQELLDEMNKYYSPDICNLVSAMVHTDPAQRPTFKQALLSFQSL